MPAGIFRDTCFVPGDLLNNGVHRVELLIVRDDTRVIHRQDDILIFDVHDTPDMRGAWYGKWPGAVRPIFKWQTELIESLPSRGGEQPVATVRPQPPSP